MILKETYTLNNGVKIPKLGLGTWFIADDKAAQAVKCAVDTGYRLIDTAQAYGNERGVGEDVRICGVARDALFVASKIAAEHKTYESAAKSIDEKLVNFCKEKGILIEAYSPIAHGEALKNPQIVKMAQKYKVSAAQLCIRYAISLGTVALPKTDNPEHIKANAEVDFEISNADMETLLKMERIKSYGEYDVFPVFGGKPLS